MKTDVFYSKFKQWLELNGIDAIKMVASVTSSDMIKIDKSRIKSCDILQFNGNRLFRNLKVYIDESNNIVGLSVGQPSAMMLMVLMETRDFLGLPYREVIKRQDDNILDLYC